MSPGTASIHLACERGSNVIFIISFWSLSRKFPSNRYVNCKPEWLTTKCLINIHIELWTLGVCIICNPLFNGVIKQHIQSGCIADKSRPFLFNSTTRNPAWFTFAWIIANMFHRKQIVRGLVRTHAWNVCLVLFVFVPLATISTWKRPCQARWSTANGCIQPIAKLYLPRV